MQVQESFTIPGDSASLGTATVACFLIQEGADASICNNQGLSPTEVCSPVVAAMVMTFRDELATKTYDRRCPIQLSLLFFACLPSRVTKFHGSLRAPALPLATVVGNLVSTYDPY